MERGEGGPRRQAGPLRLRTLWVPRGSNKLGTIPAPPPPHARILARPVLAPRPLIPSPRPRPPEHQEPPIEDPRIPDLLREGHALWRDYCQSRASEFHRVIPADQAAAVDALAAQRPHAHTFLELGSATGVITILADLLGYEAYGIEIEPDLVRAAEDLAARTGSSATFVEGSFVPPDYRDEVHLLESDYLTPVEGADAYDELGLDLADFDLVYAYPWPGEEDWLIELVTRYGGPRTRLMIYTVRDGFEVVT